MSKPARQASLERIAAYWNRAKLASLPALLWGMYTLAKGEKAKAQQKAAELYEYALDNGVTEQQLSQAMTESDHRSTAPEPTAADMPWEATYVSHLLALSALQNQEEIRVRPELLSFSMAGVACLADVTKKLKIEADIKRIETARGIQARWQSGQPRFEAAMAGLCSIQLHTAERKASQLIQELLLDEELFKRIATRRTETKKLQSVKENQQKKVKAAIQYWAKWKSLQRSLEQPGTQQEVELTPRMITDAYAGIVPWTEETNAGLASWSSKFGSHS